jgi:hypothetical protein
VNRLTTSRFRDAEPVGLLQRLKDWRERKRDDREAIARERAQERRADDEQERSLSDTVGDTAGQYPSQN